MSQIQEAVNTPRLMKFREIAEEAEVSVKTVRNWGTHYGLPIVRLGGQYRVRRDDWLEFRNRKAR